MASRDARKYGRLRAETIAEIDSGAIRMPKPGPRIRKPGTSKNPGLRAHVLTALREGEVLPWVYIVAFWRLLREKNPERFQGLTADHIAEPAEKPPFDYLRMPDLLYSGWGAIIDFFRHAAFIDPLCACDPNRPDDFEEMADLILDSLGWLYFSKRGEQKKASPDAARAKGEERSGVKYDAWVRWLQGLCQKEFRTVLFAVENIPFEGNHCNRRLGSVIAIPLKEATWQRVRAGEIGYSKLTGDDIQTPSRHILLHSLSEVRPSKWPGGKKISFAQIRTLMYQLATFTPALSPKKPETWPSILCLAPLHLHQKRTPAFGFKRTQAIEPDTKTYIWELIPPQFTLSPRSWLRAASYGMMIAPLMFFQMVHREEVLELPG